LQLSRNWDDWSTFSDSSFNEFLDITLLSNATSSIFNNDIDFVLNNNNLIKVHNLDSS